MIRKSTLSLTIKANLVVDYLGQIVNMIITGTGLSISLSHSRYFFNFFLEVKILSCSIKIQVFDIMGRTIIHLGALKGNLLTI